MPSEVNGAFQEMRVHVVADTAAKLTTLRAMLEPNVSVTSELLGGVAVQRCAVDAVVVKACLRLIENICAVKRIINALPKVSRRIFIVEENQRLQVSQAYALGASRVLLGPVNRAGLLAELIGQLPGDAVPPTDMQGSQAAAAHGELALATMFAAAANGMSIDIQSTKDAAQHIADSIAEDGLSDWLTTVRRHHEGTYQHCLLVTGIAIDFGLQLGVPNRDLERLQTAAIFHDVGKARIPIEILDKPGRLGDSERKLIETHPAAGYDLLKSNPQISAEILDAVRHHHEYLDGSGYPDGLCAANITDIVRILTISDIFAALIENRRYRPPMPREGAYAILQAMNEKLEKPLVVAFRDVALRR